jgi:hypothetical protein
MERKVGQAVFLHGDNTVWSRLQSQHKSLSREMVTIIGTHRENTGRDHPQAELIPYWGHEKKVHTKACHDVTLCFSVKGREIVSGNYNNSYLSEHFIYIRNCETLPVGHLLQSSYFL